MKKIKLTVAALSLLALAACQKGQNTTIQTKVSTDEAADMVSGSLAVSSNGAVSTSIDLSASANVAVNSKFACGATKTDSVSRSNSSGAVTYNYFARSTYTVNCNSAGIPDNLTATGSFFTTYNGPNLYFNHVGSSTLTISGLVPTSASYVLNGERKASGLFKSKVDTTNNGSDVVDIVISQLTISKTTHLPVSGGGTFTITGTIPKKGTFNFAGTIVVNADATATVTVNTTVYIINLITGQRTRK